MTLGRVLGVGIELDVGVSEVLIGLGALSARTSGLLAAAGSVCLLSTRRTPKIPITMAPTITNAMAAQINGLDRPRFGCGSAASNGETPAPAKPVIVGTVCFGGDVGGIGPAGEGKPLSVVALLSECRTALTEERHQPDRS